MISNRVSVPSMLPTPPNAGPSRTGIANAYASADPRQAAKQYDRAGISRGRGSWNQAGIDAAKNFAAGIASVYDDQLKRQSDNANTMLALNEGQERYGQALGALQSQAVYADQMAALQRRGALYGLLGDLMG